MNKKIRANLLLLLTAFIWGSTFVAQNSAADKVEPFTYNASRSILAFVMLLPVIFFMEKAWQSGGTKRKKSLSLPENKMTVIGGVCCGLALFTASYLQQTGIGMTTAGKAGFITALYIVIVPILGILTGKKVGKVIWLCVLLAVAGFYLLCVKEGFSIASGDLYVLACAFVFSLHIMIIDHFSPRAGNVVMMSAIQFLVVSLLSAVFMMIMESPSLEVIKGSFFQIAYAGILSSAVGYTLQIVAQRDADPAVASLIMSLESVFAALSGWIFLHEKLSFREFSGCALVFVAVILCVLFCGSDKKKEKSRGK